MSYNYILDSNIVKNFNLNIANSIIIIDEGHNISNLRKFITGQASLKKYELDVKRDSDDDDDDLIVH